ncbi:hypothetical protein Tco_0465393 [Tanacetum coccineum]
MEPYSTKTIKLCFLLQEEEMSMSLICHLSMKKAMLVSLPNHPIVINPSDDSPDLSIADNHHVHNEPDDFKPAETHINDITEVQDITINDINTTNEVEPSLTLILPSAEINHDTLARQMV